MYDGTFDEANEDVLAPNNLIQTLLREFRTYDMIYRVIFYLVRDEEILAKVKKLQEEAANEDSTGRVATAGKDRGPRKDSMVLEDISARNEVKFPEILKCFKAFKKIIIISYKKNRLNRSYTCQFIRVLINSILGT